MSGLLRPWCFSCLIGGQVSPLCLQGSSVFVAVAACCRSRPAGNLPAVVAPGAASTRAEDWWAFKAVVLRMDPKSKLWSCLLMPRTRQRILSGHPFLHTAPTRRCRPQQLDSAPHFRSLKADGYAAAKPAAASLSHLAHNAAAKSPIPTPCNDNKHLAASANLLCTLQATGDAGAAVVAAALLTRVVTAPWNATSLR